MAPLRRRAQLNRASKAFTLIELLVVIAIIAILTAILLPVFAAVRENSRQGVSISNLKDIQQKMEQFKLDNHKYPDVLFGYAYPNSTMKTGLGLAQQYDAAHQGDPVPSHVAALYFPGLYPAYIKDVEEFTDPNNTVNSSDTDKITSALSTNLVAPCNVANDNVLRNDTNSACGPPAAATGPTPGTIVPTKRFFYLADAYDSNPQVTGANTIGTISLVRYQVARLPTAATIPTVDPAASEYKRQLRWQNPPAETFITCSTYHVKYADKVLVLFESGAVKKMTGEEFATGVAGSDNNDSVSAPDYSVTPAVTTNFWKVTP